MNKTCLIIDDNKQDEVLERLVEKAKKKGVTLVCPQFNVGSTERGDLLRDGLIDKSLVVDKFKDEFKGTKLDLICIDYQLEDDSVTGLDILKLIHDLRKSSQFMIYSSSIDEVARGIIDNYDIDQDKPKLVSNIKALTKYKIADFVSRDRYEQVILELVINPQSSLELVLEEKLLEHSELVFENTYPVFEGRSLQEIAIEIRNNTHHGNQFKAELIEQAIAYMLKVNS